MRGIVLGIGSSGTSFYTQLADRMGWTAPAINERLRLVSNVLKCIPLLYGDGQPGATNSASPGCSAPSCRRTPASTPPRSPGGTTVSRTGRSKHGPIWRQDVV